MGRALKVGLLVLLLGWAAGAQAQKLYKGLASSVLNGSFYSEATGPSGMDAMNSACETFSENQPDGRAIPSQLGACGDFSCGYPVEGGYATLWACAGFIEIDCSSTAHPDCGKQDEPEKDEGGCNGQNATGNPCNVASGNKFQSETDFSNGQFSFIRSYNSRALANLTLGLGWRSNFHKALTVAGDSLTVVSGAGRGEPWSKVDDSWVGDVDSKVVITQTGSGFELARHNGATETYSANGTLLAETDASGNATVFAYNAQGRLETVTNHYGSSISFTYLDGRIDTVTDQNGSVYKYVYDELMNNLVEVIYPDLTPGDDSDNPRRIYHYEHDEFLHHLTGITDENGNRYATWAYDSEGRAVSSEHAQTSNATGQEQVTIDYQTAIIPTRVVTDANDTQEIWTFDEVLGASKLTSRINQTDGKGLSQTWDADGNLLSRTDAEGRTTTYSYNASNQRTSMTAAFGTPLARTTTYEYVSPDIDLVKKEITPSVKAGHDKEVVTSYDVNYNVTGITINGFDQAGNPVSRTTAFTHDSFGKVAGIDGPRTDVSDTTTLDYYDCTTSAECGQLEKITNALGQETHFDAYDDASRLWQRTDPNGVVTTYTYHPRGWVTSITETPPLGSARITTFDYDNVGQLVRAQQPDGSEQIYEYDAARDLRVIRDNLGNMIEYVYDANGNQVQESTFDPDGTLVRSVTLAYDSRNFLSAINAAGSLTQIINDAVGNATTQTDPNLNPSTEHGFDELDRLTQTMDALAKLTGYQYDVADQLTQVTAPNGAVTQYQYDDLGNRTRETSADRGVVSYTHDAAGNIVGMTDARGVTTQYSYDVLDRLTGVSYPQPGEDVAYFYDQPGDAQSDCGASIGRLCTVTDASGSYDYAYDEWGNVTHQRWQTATASIDIGYEYDELNRITRVVYPSGLIVDYARDSIGRVAAVHAPGDTTTEIIADQFTYRADGLLTGYRTGSDQLLDYHYDLQGRLTQLAIDDVVLASYQYDDNSNLETLSQPDQDRTFSFDELDRLEAGNEIGGSYGIDDRAYTYDENGNRTALDIGATSQTLQYSAASNINNQIDAAAVAHDAAGNTTSLPRRNGDTLQLAYNQQQQLAQITSPGNSTSYGYNHLRQRVSKQGNEHNSQYLYDLAGRLLATLDEQGVVHEEYVYGADNTFTPVHHRLYDDTEAATVEANLALFNSQQSISDPVNDGQCEAYERTDTERLSSNVLSIANEIPAPKWEQKEEPRNDADSQPTAGKPASAAPNMGWLVSIIGFLLDEPDKTYLNGKNDPIADSQRIITWNGPGEPSSSDLRYVVDVATTRQALNNGPDIARHCVQQGSRQAELNHLPLNGTNLYIRIWQQDNGVWVYEDFELETEAQVSAARQITRSYPVTDHLDTPRFVYDDNKTLTWRWASDGFGDTTTDNDPDGDGYQNNLSMRFPGQYYDQESDLHYNWNRYYDPETGRYVTSDPIGLDGGLNTFGYASQNPQKHIDPHGLFMSNGNFWPGFDSQDWNCSPPMANLNSNKCAKKCCAQHDLCYAFYGCNASSWFSPSIGACSFCNAVAVGCIIGSMIECRDGSC